MMKSTYKLLFFFVIIVFAISLLGCEDDADFTQKNYPIIQTHEVTEVDKFGAVFNGEFLKQGIDKTINHGFVWSRTPNPTLGNFRIYLGSEVQSMVSVKVTFDLVDNVKYYVRAYATTMNDTVYGNSVQFKSLGSSYPIVIKSINPLKGIDGDTLIIEGENFGSTITGNIVSIGATKAKVIEVSNTKLKVIVPNMPSVQSYKVNVQTNGKSTTSSESFVVQSPVITSFSPVSGKPGTTVTIHGDYFSKDFTYVLIGGLYCKMLQQSRHKLVVQSHLYPYIYGNSELKVSVNGKSIVSETYFFVEEP